MDNKMLIDKVMAGFDTLDISKKYTSMALKWMEIWLTDDAFKEYRAQIHFLIEKKEWNFLLDSFYQIIPFGTGGRRGLVGIGPNRINTWTIQASAQGHSQYILKQYGDKAKKRGVVLTFDARKYTQQGIYDDTIHNPVMNLDGKQLAMAAAEVYAANDIRVYFFETERSTPELSFAIRHLNAISGDMFSASHNLPTDNGKKVYDEYGGQLIPPQDQILVDEVTNNVKEIKKISFLEAKNNGLVRIVGEEVDNAYHKAAAQVSLSDATDINIVYSPLHGTGLSSVYPILKILGFNVNLDPTTSNLSGAFENVTFNIPNPEVEASFDCSMPFAKEIDADIIINTDPDADRIGVKVKDNGKWHFLNGNEIGIILTNYVISKFKARGLLTQDSVVIKTIVTSYLIDKITKTHNIKCISDLLVGFKYIGEEMNKIEKEGKINNFLFGTEESHGYITGNYARDKDAACAAIWIAQLAAELKQQNKTLLDDLRKIYSTYGYCHNYLTEIRLIGAKGMEDIMRIMDHLRKNKIPSFDAFKVQDAIDRWDGPPQPHLSSTDTFARNVLIYDMKNLENTENIKITIRPSGTEPKIKMYFEVLGKPCPLEGIDEEKEKIVLIREQLEKSFMLYCYKILGIDFPERGFLLFWQLPLDDKLKYFKIEEDLIKLKSISSKDQRKDELFKLLTFLGANPVKKIDQAFSKKYKTGILEYLELS